VGWSACGSVLPQRARFLTRQRRRPWLLVTAVGPTAAGRTAGCCRLASTLRRPLLTPCRRSWRASPKRPSRPRWSAAPTVHSTVGTAVAFSGTTGSAAPPVAFTATDMVVLILLDAATPPAAADTWKVVWSRLLLGLFDPSWPAPRASSRSSETTNRADAFDASLAADAHMPAIGLARCCCSMSAASPPGGMTCSAAGRQRRRRRPRASTSVALAMGFCGGSPQRRAASHPPTPRTVGAVGSRRERAGAALAAVGMPVLHDAAPTSLAVLATAGSTSYVSVASFQMLISLFVLGAAPGCLKTSIVLSLIGSPSFWASAAER